MPIDLHAHTTASDGTLSPRELVAHARDLGLTVVAISDHDTYAGWQEALQAGRELGIGVVPAIEFSVSDEKYGKFHLLGYFPRRETLDGEQPNPLMEELVLPATLEGTRLGREISELQTERARRNDVIFENLERLGVGVSPARVREIAGPDAQIGRPHIAQAMIERGYVSSIQQAFDEWLAEGKPAAAKRSVLTPKRAVELIHEAGGVAVWAHPTRQPSERAEILDFTRGEALLQKWKEWDLDGLEIYYGAYTSEEAAWTRAMSEKYNLLGTGGSDFHGATKPNVPLGKVNGGGSVPEEVLTTLYLRYTF